MMRKRFYTEAERYTYSGKQLLRWKTTATASSLKAAPDATDEFLAEWKAAKPFDQLPGFKSTPATVWAMLGLDFTKFLDFNRDCLKKFGPIYKMNIPIFPTVVVSTSPEDSEK